MTSLFITDIYCWFYYYCRHNYLNGIHHHSDIWKPDIYFIKHGTFKVWLLSMQKNYVKKEVKWSEAHGHNEWLHECWDYSCFMSLAQCHYYFSIHESTIFFLLYPTYYFARQWKGTNSRWSIKTFLMDLIVGRWE